MKKNQKIIMAFMIATIVSLGWLVSVLIRGDASIIEQAVSICSVLVTLLLGVVTYAQTNTQIDIEAMDKTPYLRVLLNEKSKIEKDYCTNGTNFLFDNIRYLEGRQADQEFFVEMTLENISDICIENVTCYIACNEDNTIEFKKVSGEVNAYTKLSNLKVSNVSEKIKNIMKEEFEIWDRKSINLLPINNMIGNEKRTLGLQLLKKPEENEVLKYFVIFDINTIYGFEYTELLELNLERVGINKEKTKFLLAIEKYNTKIYSMGFNKCKKKIIRYINSNID